MFGRRARTLELVLELRDLALELADLAQRLAIVDARLLGLCILRELVEAEIDRRLRARRDARARECPARTLPSSTAQASRVGTPAVASVTRARRSRHRLRRRIRWRPRRARFGLPDSSTSSIDVVVDRKRDRRRRSESTTSESSCPSLRSSKTIVRSVPRRPRWAGSSGRRDPSPTKSGRSIHRRIIHTGQIVDVRLVATGQSRSDRRR